MNKWNQIILTIAAIMAGLASLQLMAAEDETELSPVSVDFIYVDNPNGKFGEYNGMNEDHNYVVFGLDWSARDDNAPEQYWGLNIHNLGLDTFFVKGEYGKQGNYRFRAGYDQLQKVYHDDGLTIYDKALDTLAEPRKKTTSSKRKTGSFGFDKIFSPMWELTTDFRSQDKNGSRSRPVNSGLIVPQQLDFTHNEFDAAMIYNDDRMQLRLGTYYSHFENDNDLILQTAAEPDNSFYQVNASGGYIIDPTSRATAYLSYSSGEQDDNFSKYGIDSGTYSTNSLDAEFDTWNFQLGYRNRITRKFYIDANYRLESRGNDTPLYDDFPSDKNNKVYEWDKHKLDIKAGYRLPARWRLRGGVVFKDYQYKVKKSPRATGRLTEQAAKLSDSSEEYKTWAEIRTPTLSGFYGSLKYSYSDRDVDLDRIRKQAARDPGGIALSTYLVDREQDKLDLLFAYSLTQSLSASFNFTRTEDDYDPVAWAGLNNVDTSIYTFDVNYTPDRDYSLTFYAGVEDLDVKQSGFGDLSDATSRWNYKIEDDSDIFGVTARLDNLSGFIDLSVDYRFQKGDGHYKTNDPTDVSGAFPDLDTNINSITINADIFLSNNLDLNISYIYENYDSSSWVWKNDFNEPGSTYFDTLNYGYESPDYTTQVFRVGATYKF